MTNPLGPQIEQLDSSDRVTSAAFAAVIGCLLADEITFPHPFTIIASAILAGNTDSGIAALDAFQESCQRTPRAFHVRLVEVVDATMGPIEREILDTRLPRRVMARLLQDAAARLWNEGDEEHGQEDDLRTH